MLQHLNTALPKIHC